MMRWLVEYKNNWDDHWTVIADASSQEEAESLAKSWRHSHPLYEWRVRQAALRDDRLENTVQDE